MKYFSLLTIWVVLSLSMFAQTVDPSKYSAPIKVACIGNSITYGSGISDRPRDSYPSQLAQILGDKWEVRNFGVGGRTLLKKGDFPFWNEEAYAQAKAFLPDVVIIKLGTNIRLSYTELFLRWKNSLKKKIFWLSIYMQHFQENHPFFLTRSIPIPKVPD